MNNRTVIGFTDERLSRAQFRHACVLYIGTLAGAIAAVAYALTYGFTTLDIGLLIAFYSLSFLGITVGYHRYFSHRSFTTGPFVEVMLAAMGSTAGQGSVFYWASNHRRHHQFSDQPDDLHSPYVHGEKIFGKLEGLWFAQIQFGWSHSITNSVLYIKDLLKKRHLRVVNAMYLPIFFAGLLLPAMIGWLATGKAQGALSGLLFGGLLRTFLVLQFTNTINSITHYFGSRRYHTTDQSRNNAWLSIPTLGESWHNNHHAFPRSAYIGFHWWELDLGGLFIRMLVLTGAASNPVTIPESEKERKKLAIATITPIVAAINETSSTKRNTL